MNEARPTRCRVALPALVPTACLALLGAAFGPAAQAQSWRISPSISLTETFSDNVGLNPAPLAEHGWISDLSPGLRVENSLGARAHVFVDYRLHQLFYSNDSTPNETQHFLDALTRIQLVERTLFLDARAAISQEARSAFGTALAPNTPGVQANRTETRVWRISPFLRGSMSDLAIYKLQYEYSDLRAEDVNSRAATHHVSGQIRNPSGGTKLGWSVDVESLELRRRDQDAASDSRLRAALWATLLPTFQVAVSEGYETHNNLLGEGRRNEDVPGLGLSWQPSPRTHLTSIWEKRFFGTGSATTFTHRTPRTAWRFAATRDVTALPTLVSASNGTSLGQLLDDLLTASIVNPQERADAVARRFERSGLADATPLDSNFLSTRPLLDKAFAASVVYTGARDTFNFLATMRDQRALADSTVADSFTLSDRIRRTGFYAGFAHNLTPLTALNLNGSRLRTKGLSVADVETVQGDVSLYISSQLGPRTSVTFGVRHSKFDSTIEGDYRESAIFATFAYGLGI